MLNIPKLTTKNISKINANTSFESLKDFDNNTKTINSVVINLDTEEYCKILEEQDAVAESYGDVLNDLVVEAFEEFEDISVNNRIFTIDIEVSGDAAESFSKKYFDSLLEGVNEEIKSNLEKKVGSELEHFIKAKENEKEIDLQCDYNNAVSSAVQSRLRDELGDKRYAYLSRSNGVPFVHVDLKQYNFETQEDGGLGFELEISKRYRCANEEMNDPVRCRHHDKIDADEFVEETHYVQKNNYTWIRIFVTEEFKNYVKTVCEEETNKFYNNPRYNLENTAYIGRVNNGKGQDADVWRSQNSGNLIIKTGNNPKDKIEINAFDNNQDNDLAQLAVELNKSQSPKKSRKNKIR